MPWIIDQLWVFVLLIPAAVVISALKIFREYERGVIFLLGRFWKVKGPGLVIVIPVIQQMVRVDLRMRVLDVPAQDVISRDNVSVKVNAVLYFRVVDAQRAIIEVEDIVFATSQLAQTTLRSILGQHDLDAMLAEREKLNAHIQVILDEVTDAWGIKVSRVELKHVDLNEIMIRAIARQAEAERNRRAKVIDAEGELQAAGRFLEAAEILAKRPQAMQLRYLTTLQTITGDKNSIILFPFPIEWSRVFAEAGEKSAAGVSMEAPARGAGLPAGGQRVEPVIEATSDPVSPKAGDLPAGL